MQSNRQYITRVYSAPLKPQQIKKLTFDETLNLNQIISNAYQKVNEIIEVTPNNFPVMMCFEESHTTSQITITGTAFINTTIVTLNETLSTLFDNTVNGEFYVNLFCDPEQPTLEVSNMFMEINWITLYKLTVENGNIIKVVWNDIYCYTHDHDVNAHPEIQMELEDYLKTLIVEYDGSIAKEYVVYDSFRDGNFPRAINVPIDTAKKYETINVLWKDYYNRTFNSFIHLKDLPINNVYYSTPKAFLRMDDGKILLTDSSIQIRVAESDVPYIVQIMNFSGNFAVYTDIQSTPTDGGTTSTSVTTEATPYIVPARIILGGYRYE